MIKKNLFLFSNLTILSLLSATMSWADNTGVIYDIPAPTVVKGEHKQFTSRVEGMGRVLDLNKALALSPTLSDLYSNLKSAGTQSQRTALLPHFMLEWVNADPNTVVVPQKEAEEPSDVTGKTHGVSDTGYHYFQQVKHDPNAPTTVIMRGSNVEKILPNDYKGPKYSEKDMPALELPVINITIPEDTIDKIEIINAFFDLAPRPFFYMDQNHATEIVKGINDTYQSIEDMIYSSLRYEL